MKLTEEQQRLIEEHMPRARRFAASFQRTTLSQDERIASAYYALCGASAKWRPERGVQFWTYAETAIRNQIFKDAATNTFTPRWKNGVKIVSGHSGFDQLVGRQAAQESGAHRFDRWRDRLELLMPLLKTQVGDHKAESIRLRMQGLKPKQIAAMRGTKPQSERDLVNRAITELKTIAWMSAS